MKVFFHLKFGEIWQELDGNYLQRRPPTRITPMYRDVIRKLSMRFLHWANYFRSEQLDIVQKYEDMVNTTSVL